MFKSDVLTTNHRWPERQLLVKDAIRFTIQAILNNAFAESDPVLTSLFERLRKCCPILLEDTLGSVSDDAVEYSRILDIGQYVQIAVQRKFKSRSCQQKQMPTRMNRADSTFLCLMESAIHVYNLRSIIWRSRPLYWYEQYLYIYTVSKTRSTLYINNYIVLCSGEYTQVLKLFTYCLQFELSRQVFV
jgi:hypothetical protein